MNIGSYVFPTGIVYADKDTEMNGDYKRLAFLSFRTLELEISKDCPREARGTIIKDAIQIQSLKGQEYPVSASGQTITLGYGIDESQEQVGDVFEFNI